MSHSGAGFETTSTTLMWWTLAMSHSAEHRPNLMPWSAVRVSLHMRTLRGFPTCAQSLKKFFAGDLLSDSDCLTTHHSTLQYAHPV